MQQPLSAIVEVGHTVTFSKIQTMITDEEGRYRLQYGRARISRMDNAHGSHGGYYYIPPELPTVSHGTLTITEQALEQKTGATTADLPQPRAQRPLT